MTKNAPHDSIDDLLVMLARDFPNDHVRAQGLEADPDDSDDDHQQDRPEGSTIDAKEKEEDAAADRFLQRLAAIEATSEAGNTAQHSPPLGDILNEFRGNATIEDFAARFSMSPVDVLSLEAAALPLKERDESTAMAAAELTEVQPLKILRVLRAIRAREHRVERNEAPLLMAARTPATTGGVKGDSKGGTKGENEDG